MPKRMPCRNKCGTQIWFDWERKYDDLGYREGSNKPNIPLECGEDGEFLPKRHDCPESEYNRMGRQEQVTTVKEAPAQHNVSTVLEAKVDSIGHRVENIESMLNKLIVHLTGNIKTDAVGMIDDDDDDDHIPNPMDRE